jgi:glycosyltransferase involved in cell wall biosynthesis
MNPALRILGIRGVPAAHGGFETFAERLALYLAARGWRVTVYCQQAGSGPVTTDTWQGVQRINIPVAGQGPKGTIVFDWRSTRDAARAGEPCLTLGYNTAVFCALLRWAGVHNTINMDGIEWRRDKWGPVAKAWFWLNEHAGSWLGHQLVADHPDIARHLQRNVSAAKITIIPYGADRLAGLPDDTVRACGLQPGGYLTLIARPEPENSVLEIVQAFSRKPRGLQLAVLGDYREENPYHRAVRAAAGPEVLFLGAIYKPKVVHALRLHCLAYVHGHRVGGTNPSLVEALGAGNPVIAHDNVFNRWVAGDSAVYFSGTEGAAVLFDTLPDDTLRLRAMRAAALRRHEAVFTWESVLDAYETLLLRRG